MSGDIRSYFKTKPTAKNNESDIIPESPQMQPKSKAKKNRRKRALSDDSDEASPKKKVHKKALENDKSGNKKKSSGKTLTEVKSSNLFGGGLIKRTEPLLKKQKTTETGIHSDDEFEMSLVELDKIEEIESANTSNKIDNKNDKVSNKAIDGNKATDKITNNSKSEVKEKSTTESVDKNDKTTEAVKKETKANDKTKDTNKNKSKKESVKDDKTEPNTNSSSKKNSSKATVDIADKVTGKIEVETKTNSRAMLESKNEMKIIIEPILNVKGKKKIKQEEGSRLDNLKNNGVAIKAAKTDFSEFISDTDDEKLDTPKGKKRKLDKSLNDSVLTDEERHERRIASAALYKSYLNRSGPKHLGEKTIPQGTPDCLKDCAFVLTGVMDSFEKDDIAKAIADFGGCVKSAVTKKVTHVLAGEDAGPAKMAKAEELNIKIINENDFLQMIVDRSKNDASKAKVKTEPESAKKKSIKSSKSPTDKHTAAKNKKHDSTTAIEKSNSGTKIEFEQEKIDSTGDIKKSKSDGFSMVKKETAVSECRTVEKQTKPENAVPSKSPSPTTGAMLWVDKYKPQNSKNIIGQHGPASNVKKLTNWLTKWYANRKAKLPKPNPWAKNDDGAYYKAALLSGPPGVGKTTTVTLVCKELGFDVVEFNASDTRNKALIKQQIGELLTTNSLSAYAKGDTSKQAVTKKHVLVMDEVDGMAGNEDRGGLQELIGLIKSTSVPIVCTCNDRNSPKMRSLVNYCYDLRFKRPTVEQIKSALSSVCFKEGIKAPPDVLAQIAISAGQDVRHTLHLASLWAASPTATNSTNITNSTNPTNPTKRPDQTRPTKDVKLGPWDAVRKVFTAAEHASMSINEKSDLFFYDYSLAPLFVQENYLQVVPHCPKDKLLSRVSMAADSISMGDLVEARIRRNQSWNLLPTQAMFSSVIPGHAMAGHMAGQIQFPGWLGKNSRAGKMRRLAQEIHAHTRLSTSGSKSSIFLDYCMHLRDAIINPMLKNRSEGVAESLNVLQSYHLLREDLDSLIELSLWPGQRNPMILVESKVKAAMTRAYNKRAAALPYAPPEAKRSTKRDPNKEQQEDSEIEEEDTDYEALAAGY